MVSALLSTLIRRFRVASLITSSRGRRLSAGEWGHIVRALPVVLYIRLALWSMTTTRLHARLVRRAAGSGGLTSAQVEGLSKAVSRAARLVPNATCLTRALALQYLLRKHGQPSRLEIGFLKGEAQDVKGHAWLVSGDQVVIGGVNSANFTRTLTLEG